MDNNIIVFYENKKLIIQTDNVIINGIVKVINKTNVEKELFEHEVTNTNFISLDANLPCGKYQIQIVTTFETNTKDLIINQR